MPGQIAGWRAVLEDDLRPVGQFMGFLSAVVHSTLGKRYACSLIQPKCKDSAMTFQARQLICQNIFLARPSLSEISDQLRELAVYLTSPSLAVPASVRQALQLDS